MGYMEDKEKALKKIKEGNIRFAKLDYARRVHETRHKAMLRTQVKEITKSLEHQGFEVHLDFKAQKQFDGQDQTMTFRNKALGLDIEVSIMGRLKSISIFDEKEKYEKLNMYAVSSYNTHTDSHFIFDTTQYDYLATYLKGFGHSVHISAQEKFNFAGGK
jgi:hypothetical protein